jgi:WD40 repeat protein
LYKSNILLATTLIPDSEYLSAEQALWQTPERLRGWEWGYLLRACHPEMRRFTTPADALASATLSPDGRLLALGGVTGGLTVVDYETGSERYRVAAGTLQRTTAEFSTDGTYVLVTIEGEAARLCDAQSGELLQTFGDLRGLPQKMSAISPSALEIALMVDFPNARVITFGIESEKVLQEVDNGQDLIHSIAYSPDGTEIVAGTLEGNTLIIDAARGAVVGRLKRNKSTILAAGFSSDGSAILTGSASGHVRLWSRGPGELIWEHEAYDAAVESVAFQPGGSLVAAGLRDGSVRVLAAVNGKEVGSLRGHAGTVTDVSFVEGGESILSASRDGTARVWRLDSALHTARVPIVATASSAMDVSADAALVAVTPQSPSGSRCLEVYDVDSGSERLAIAGIGGHINHVRFGPGGDLIGVSSGRGAFVFDSDSGELVQAFHGHQSDTAEIRFAPDGRTVAIGYWDGSVQIRDVSTGRIVQALAGLDELVRCVAYSSDGRLLAAGDDAGIVKIWNASDGSIVNQLSIPESQGVRGLSFDSNGNKVWIGGRDSSFVSWSLTTGNSRTYPPAHAGPVRDLVLSPDDARLASTFGDGTVRVFDTSSGEELLRFAGQSLSHCGIAWLSDGTRLFHLDEDGDVAIREADPWRARILGTDNEHDWRERYAAFKLAERAKAQPIESDPGPIPQVVSMPEIHMAVRFDRLRSVAMADGNDFWVDRNGETGIRIDSDALLPVVRDFGLISGDIITHLDGKPLGDWDGSRVIADDSAIPSSLTVVRNGRTRKVQFRAVELFRETLHATMDPDLLKFGLTSVDDLRFVSDEATRIQRRYSENIGLPVEGEGIDGIWVMPMGEEVNDGTTKEWAIILNGLFGAIGLRDGDHVVEINGTPIDSIETIARLIEAAGPAMEAGEPYEFVIIIDRTLFQRIELRLKVDR